MYSINFDIFLSYSDGSKSVPSYSDAEYSCLEYLCTTEDSQHTWIATVIREYANMKYNGDENGLSIEGKTSKEVKAVNARR